MLIVKEHFFTVAEAAKVIGVERHTVGRWIRAGKLEAQRIGVTVLIEKKAVEELRKG